MNNRSRIDKLESLIGADKPQKMVVLIHGGPKLVEGVDIIWVVNEATRQLILRILNGEGTE